MTASIAERVAAGVAWLDADDPNWWKPDRIDLDELNMAHPCYCVLGQSRGNYYAAPITVEQCVAMGFDTAAGATGDPTRMVNDVEYVTQVLAAAAVEFDDLATEWARVIEERRAQTAGAS